MENFGIIGLHCFDQYEVTVTVTNERYFVMEKIFFIPKLQRRNIDRKLLWFQQDEAKAPAAMATMDFLRHLFLNHLTLDLVRWASTCRHVTSFYGNTGKNVFRYSIFNFLNVKNTEIWICTHTFNSHTINSLYTKSRQKLNTTFFFQMVFLLIKNIWKVKLYCKSIQISNWWKINK